MNNIKLTQLSSGAGWACKIGQEDLAEVLKNLNINEKDFDDCSIYDIDSKKAIIQSVDFFTPIVDDPYEFGQIAAANSLSDIYAMGAKPLFALNIAGFPSKDLDLSILSRILEGGQNIASKAKINILGGHTIKDKEPKYGLVVTGIADKKKIIRNNNAKPKDDLVLTKPIGTGIIATAIKKNLLEKNLFNQTIDSMKELNMNSANLMQNYLPNACTDITGFGLIGHLLEMTKNSNVSAEINYENICLHAKFSLNIHYYKGKSILEVSRIIPLICRGIIVITEKSDDIFYDEIFKDICIFVDFDDINNITNIIKNFSKEKAINNKNILIEKLNYLKIITDKINLF